MSKKATQAVKQSMGRSSQGAETEFDSARSTVSTVRLGRWIVLLGFGGFVLWASLAPLSEGVPAQASVVIDTKRKPIQHQTGGIVRDVQVREGDWVQEGQVLLELEDANAKAQFEGVRQQYLALRASESRLMAEQLGLGTIDFHPDLKSAMSDSFALRHMANHQQIFESRRKSLASELGALQENMLGLEAQQMGSKALLVQRKASLALLREQAQQTRTLADEGYLPRNRQLELDRQLSDLVGQISDLEAGVERGARSVAEMRLRMDQRRSDYRKEVDTQLADVRREVEALEERLQAVKLELGRTSLKSPASGQVIGLMVQSPGAVIGPGMKVMDIVPERETLLVEARLSPQYIDRVRQQQEVDVRFSVFANTPQLVVPGKVISLSSDLISDAAGMSRQPGSPPEYYLVRVALDNDVAASVLKHRRIQPGMPADVVIKTGERSLLQYILRPLTKRIAASLKEE